MLTLAVVQLMLSRLWKDTAKFLQHWKCPAVWQPPSFSNRRSLEPPSVYLDLTAQPNYTAKKTKKNRTGFKLCESPGVAQSLSIPEPNGASVERSENGNAWTLGWMLSVHAPSNLDVEYKAYRSLSQVSPRHWSQFKGRQSGQILWSHTWYSVLSQSSRIFLELQYQQQ